MDNLFYAASSASPYYNVKIGLQQAGPASVGSLQLRGPHLSGDYEDEMLTDYIVQSNLKRSHERKSQLRRVQKLGPIGVSKSMSALNLTPIKAQPNNQGSNCDDGDDNDTLDTSSVDPHKVSQMMGRAMLQQNLADDGAAAIEDMAKHGREMQLASMQGSVVMNQVMREVLALHATLAEVVGELRKRIEPVHLRVEVANDKYVGLFERMLAEVLLMQRSKFQANAKTLMALKEQLAAVKGKEAAGRDRVFEVNQLAAKADMAVAGMAAELAAATRDIERLNEVVKVLESEKLNMQAAMELNGRGIPERQVKQMIRDARTEEIMKATKQQNDARRKWIKEAEMRLKDNEAKAETMSMAELAAQAKKSNDFKRPKVDSSSQTEVNEQGLWDKQDGWTLPVTGTLTARQRWRAAMRFSKCPKCKGTGDFIGLCARLLKAMLRGVPLSDEDSPKGKTGSTWIMPDDLVRFMGNLPRSVMALRPRGLPWVLRRVYKLCEDKKLADDTDERLGYSLQSTPDFLIEHYLKHLPSRSETELVLYEIFSALHEHYKLHPLLHTFARFVGILDGRSAEEMVLLQRQLLEEKERKKDREAFDKMRNLGARAKTQALEKMKADEAFIKERAAGKAVAEQNIQLCDASLSVAIFGIYHYARSCLLEKYRGAYEGMIRQIKASTNVPSKYEAKFKAETDFPEMSLPDHVCLDKALRFFIPFDRAIRVLSVLLSFLEDKQYQAALRSMEALCVFFNSDGSMYLLEGMHSLVRTTMREFLQSESPDGADLTFMQIYEQQKAEGKAPPRDDENLGPIMVEEVEKDRPVMMVDLDGCLRIVVECMLLRTSFVEKRLAEIFVEGDVNGDGVLDFKEFTTIVAVVAPHFNERRIIRMFREALMLGNDDDSISPKAFVETCKKHGLVQLINVIDLRVGLLKALSLTETEKASKLARETEEAAERNRLLEVSMFKSIFQSPAERRRSALQAAVQRRGSNLGGGSPLSVDGGGNNSPAIGNAKRKPSMGMIVRAATQSSFFKGVAAGLVSPATSSPAPLPLNSDQSATEIFDGEYQQRAGSATTPTQLALVDAYAAAAGSPTTLPPSIAEDTERSPVLAPPLTPPAPDPPSSEEAQHLKDNVAKVVERKAMGISTTFGALAQAMTGSLGISGISEAEDEDDDQADEAEVAKPAASPAPTAKPQLNAPARVLEASIAVSPFAPPLNPVQNYYPDPSADSLGLPPSASIGIMPLLASRPRKDKPNEEVSRIAGTTVKEQLRLRRENRLQQRLADSARIVGSAQGGMNDSDDDQPPRGR